MTAEFLRDAAATAAVFGFFASAWLGAGTVLLTAALCSMASVLLWP